MNYLGRVASRNFSKVKSEYFQVFTFKNGARDWSNSSFLALFCSAQFKQTLSLKIPFSLEKCGVLLLSATVTSYQAISSLGLRKSCEPALSNFNKLICELNHTIIIALLHQKLNTNFKASPGGLWRV
jgi:hypothetical protein